MNGLSIDFIFNASKYTEIVLRGEAEKKKDCLE